jgi:hypothetical protein
LYPAGSHCDYCRDDEWVLIQRFAFTSDTFVTVANKNASHNKDGDGVISNVTKEAESHYSLCRFDSQFGCWHKEQYDIVVSSFSTVYVVNKVFRIRTIYK